MQSDELTILFPLIASRISNCPLCDGTNCTHSEEDIKKAYSCEFERHARTCQCENCKKYWNARNEKHNPFREVKDGRTFDVLEEIESWRPIMEKALGKEKWDSLTFCESICEISAYKEKMKKNPIVEKK